MIAVKIGFTFVIYSTLALDSFNYAKRQEAMGKAMLFYILRISIGYG